MAACGAPMTQAAIRSVAARFGPRRAKVASIAYSAGARCGSGWTPPPRSLPRQHALYLRPEPQGHGWFRAARSLPGAGCRSRSSGRSSGSATSSAPIADASSQARAQLPAHSSYSMASRIAGSRIGSSRRQDPISCRAWSDRPDPSAARARSSTGTAGCPQPSSAAIPRAHGCSCVVPGAAAVSTASATRSITVGLASHGARPTADPAASAEIQPSASAASLTSSRPRGPSSRCVSSHRGRPVRAASPAAAGSSPARSAEASCPQTARSGSVSPAFTAGAYRLLLAQDQLLCLRAPPDPPDRCPVPLTV